MVVVVCIVGYNNPDDVRRCVSSLSRSTYKQFEIVICENSSALMCEELRQALPSRLPDGQRLSVLPYEGNSGYAGGNNRCILARPDADAWWILNPDSRVAPETMGLLVSWLESNRLDAVGSTLLKPDGTVQAYGGQWVPLFGRAVSIGNGSDFDVDALPHMLEVDYILGASVMFSRHFVEKAGLMRDDYFLYGEEIEWGLRAKSLGLRLGVDRTAVVHHDQGTTTGDGGTFKGKPKLPVYLDQRNKILVLRDTSPRILFPAALGVLFALSARAVKNKAWRQFGYGVSGWVAGLANRRGMPPWLKG